MERHHIARIYWGVFFTLLILTVVSVLQVATSLNPIGVVFDSVHDATGINVNFNIPSYFTLFPPLDVVNAPVIQCTLATGFLGVSSTGSLVALSVPTTTIIPTHTFDLTTPSGKTYDNYVVREGLTCPVIATNFPPNLVSGSVTLTWTASKKDGSTVTIFSDTEQIAPKYTSGPNSGNALALPSGTLPLANLALYSWTVPKSQIESALGVNPLGDSFNSVQNIAVTTSLKFYQGNVPSTPWTVTNVGPSQISYTLHEVTGNPIAINNLDMVLKVVSPTDSTINPLQNTNVAKLQLSVTNWSTGCGGNQCNAPQYSVYFTDPTSTNPNTPIYSGYLTPDASIGPNNGVTTFSFSYPFSQNTKAGQYTFAASMTGNPTVAKANVYVKPVSPPTCPAGQYFDSDNQICKSTATKTCPDGSVISANFQCPAPPSPPGTTPPTQCPSGQIMISNSCQAIPTINWQQIISALVSSGQTGITLALIFGGLFFVYLVGSAIYHGNKKRNDEEGIPAIEEVIPEAR